MYSIEELIDIADKGILNVNIPKEPNRLYEPIRYTLASGEIGRASCRERV